jgi:hypothetical protein
MRIRSDRERKAMFAKMNWISASKPVLRLTKVQKSDTLKIKFPPEYERKEVKEFKPIEPKGK